MGMCTGSTDIITRPLKNYCGARLLRCAVLGILQENNPKTLRQEPR
jgi:hypothetical protein